MNIITGYTGTAHVTAEQDGATNATVHGTGRAVFNIGEKFAYEIVSNNSIKISDGYGINQGRYFCIENGNSESVAIATGTADTYREDLIVAKYKKDSSTLKESITIEVIEGTAGTSYVEPEYTTGNILEGDEEDDFVLYAVKINGITIESVEAKFTVVKTIDEQIEEAKKAENIAVTSASYGGTTTDNLQTALTGINTNLATKQDKLSTVTKTVIANAHGLKVTTKKYGNVMFLDIEGTLDKAFSANTNYQMGVTSAWTATGWNDNWIITREFNNSVDVRLTMATDYVYISVTSAISQGTNFKCSYMTII